MSFAPSPEKNIYIGGSFINTETAIPSVPLQNIAYFNNTVYIPLIINGAFIDTEDSPPTNNTQITLPYYNKLVSLISDSVSPSVWLVGYRSTGVTVT